MQSHELDKQIVGNVGLFLVCAELSKRNLIAMPTIRNLKGYDILVLNPNTNRAVGIQVKTARIKVKYRFQIFQSHWRDYQEKIEEHICSDWVLVDILDLEKPIFHVVPKDDLRKIIGDTIQDYAKRRMDKNHITWQDILDMEKQKQSNPHNWALSLSHISSYVDKWSIITKNIS
jgi:hypothetical protein